MPKSYLKIPIPASFLRIAVWFLLLYRKKHFGVAFRKIQLTRGKFVIIDPADFETLNLHKWCLTGFDNNFYANLYLGKINGKKKFISMHRLIMHAPPGFVVDHINGAGLNNTRANLRIVTAAQNVYNSRKTVNQTGSKYKGVCYDKTRNKFRVDIGLNGHRKFLGHFDNDADAARAYDKAAMELYGDYAKLNFPQAGERQRNEALYNKILSSPIEHFINYLSNLFVV